MKYKTKIYLLLALLFTLAGLGTSYYVLDDSNEVAQSNTDEPAPETVEEAAPAVKEDEPEPAIKKAALLSVPYTVQAPEQSWNIHEESCEEAVTLMSKYYLDGSKLNVIPAKTASNVMVKMKAWQRAEYGSEPDLTVEEIGKFGQSYYGLSYKYQKGVTKEDIKEAISAGHPVIVPVMTHSLGNPNYGAENTYHALLIKGYDANNVIANDPGISQGKDYKYPWSTIFKAIDAQKTKMDQGREMIYFY